MYVESKVKIDKDQAKEFEDQVQVIKGSIRGATKTYLGCVVCMAPVAILIFFLNRDSQYIGFNIVCGFVVIAAILGSVMLDSAVKDKVKIRSIRAAIEQGVAIERHIVASRCFSVVKDYEEEEESDDDAITDDPGASNGGEELVYYFDIGEQGVICINDIDIPSIEFPSSDMAIIELFDGNGRTLEKRIQSRGDRLLPVATFHSRDIEDSPGLEGYASAESYSVFPEKFEDLLAQLQSA